jgi:hypothetical protein
MPQIDCLTKHLALYGTLYLGLLKEADKTTRFTYTIQTKALTEYIEPLMGEDVFERFEKWVLGEPDDPSLIRLDESIKEIWDIPEDPLLYTREEMEHFDLEELREIAEDEFGSKLPEGTDRNSFIDLILKAQEERSISEEKEGEENGLRPV